MAAPQPRGKPAGLMAVLVSVLIVAAACSPAVLAVLAYRDPVLLARARREVGSHPMPLDPYGPRAAEWTRRFAERLPRVDRDRAGMAAWTATTLVFGRVERLWPIWLAAAPTIVAGFLIGWANRRPADGELEWASPLGALLAKRAAYFCVVALVLAPPLLSPVTEVTAAAVMMLIAFAASGLICLFTWNLPEFV